MALIAVSALTVSEAKAASISRTGPASNGSSASTAQGDATDFSSARRRHYNHGGNAAGLAFMGMAIGTMGAVAAQQRRSQYYNNGYGYRQQYYGGNPYYGNGYYSPY